MAVAAPQWSLATPFGIDIDEEKDAWHTGHINDMVQLDGGATGMLIASQTGVTLLDTPILVNFGGVPLQASRCSSRRSAISIVGPLPKNAL